jgi:hypothetical protein
MPQLHLYIPDDLAESIQRKAQSANLSVSRYLAELVQREMAIDWPPGYFEDVVGRWQGATLERPPQGEFEQRDPVELGR